MIPRSGFGGSTDTDTSSDTADGGDYDAGDLTGVSGDMGDDPTEDRNSVSGDDDPTVDPGSVTGVTGDGTTVTDRNAPADYTEETDEQHDGETVDGVDYTGLPDDPEQDVADQVEDASENSPVVDDVSDEEWQEMQDADNEWSDVVDDTEETVDRVVDNTQDAAEDATESVEEAIDNALDNAAAQMPDVPGADVPWKLVLGGTGVLGLLFLARPYAGLANSATS